MCQKTHLRDGRHQYLVVKGMSGNDKQCRRTEAIQMKMRGWLKRRDGWHEMTGMRDRQRTGFQYCDETSHRDTPVLTDKAELVRTWSHTDPERHPSPYQSKNRKHWCDFTDYCQTKEQACRAAVLRHKVRTKIILVVHRSLPRGCLTTRSPLSNICMAETSLCQIMMISSCKHSQLCVYKGM